MSNVSEQNDCGSFPDIDRWHSTLLDVHKWSDHPEIKALSDWLYEETGIGEFDKSGNRKPKKTAKDMLRVLLVDLYVNWLIDPVLAIGFSKDKNSYKVKSRYNQVHVSDKIIQVERRLHEAGYLDEQPFSNDRTGGGRSYTTRIRPSRKLRHEFESITADLYDIDFHVVEEVIVLQTKFVDDDNQKRQVKLDYDDTDYTRNIRGQLQSYNDLLIRSFIDIPSLEEPFVRRKIEKGRRSGQEQRISIGPDNKHVHRVFNGTPEDNFQKGGRFYGGWWLQIPKDLRKDIYINDKPTVEVDYKALHPNLLLSSPVHDPYDLGDNLLPEMGWTHKQQRDAVKSLVLMAINATSAAKAFSAFRADKKGGDPAKTLKNPQLQRLLDAFTDKYPELKDQLNTGKALYLMNLDSQIANIVIDYFTKQDVPVLCIHDSFIIQHDKEDDLKRVLHDASVQIAGKAIDQDKTSNERKIKTYVQGNIKGFEDKKEFNLTLPNKVTPTNNYTLRKRKYYKWLEVTGLGR